MRFFGLFGFILIFIGVQSAFALDIMVKYESDRTESFRPHLRQEMKKWGLVDVRPMSGVLKDYEVLTFHGKISEKILLNRLRQFGSVQYAVVDFSFPFLDQTEILSTFFCWGDHPHRSFLCRPSTHLDQTTLADPPFRRISSRRRRFKKDPLNYVQRNLKSLQARQGWKIHRGARQITVALLGTGIDYRHKDLTRNLWKNPNPSAEDQIGYDFVDDDVYPFDHHPQSHGTHVAGIVGAVGGNGVGISGVAPRVSLMSLRFMDENGWGKISHLVQAIGYAIDHGAQIINASFAIPSILGSMVPVYEALQLAEQHGLLVVAAAGNDRRSIDRHPLYPASFDLENILTVVALDERDGLASFSNYGRKSADLAAPGSSILSTIRRHRYSRMSGTSMAAPHVAGAAALIWSYMGASDYAAVKELLIESGEEIPSLKFRTTTGKKLNLFRALKLSGR